MYKYSLHGFTYHHSVNIFVGNSFKNDYILPSKPLTCLFNNIKYKCQYSNSHHSKYHASIYNGHRQFPHSPKTNYNIIITTEKLSQMTFMEKIGERKDKNYHLAVDYRLFTNKWHISKPQYSKINLTYFLNTAKINYGNISTFLNRKDIVYIQKVSYKNRQYIVKEMMKYLPIDSYGRDLNNKKWPKYINKKNKIDLLKQYKFCIAIENSIITWKLGGKYEAELINNDYVTEKLVDCLIAGCIPIYFGPKNINLFLPNPNAIINFNSFTSIESLSNYIKYIKRNITLLQKHLNWHYNYSREWMKRFDVDFTFNYCKICNYVQIYSNK